MNIFRLRKIRCTNFNKVWILTVWQYTIASLLPSSNAWLDIYVVVPVLVHQSLWWEALCACLLCMSADWLLYFNSYSSVSSVVAIPQSSTFLSISAKICSGIQKFVYTQKLFTIGNCPFEVFSYTRSCMKISGTKKIVWKSVDMKFPELRYR